MNNLLGTASYRAHQFFTALKPSLSAQDQAMVRSVFSEHRQALGLFERMAAADQQHAIAVLQTLLARGEDHQALQQAALLHDAGKALGQPLIYRVAVVLLAVFWPAGLRQLAQVPLATCPIWRKPFVVHAQHPQIGAAWAREAGCSDLTVALIERHQEKPPQHPKTLEEQLQKALYEADGGN